MSLEQVELPNAAGEQICAAASCGKRNRQQATSSRWSLVIVRALRAIVVHAANAHNLSTKSAGLNNYLKRTADLQNIAMHHIPILETLAGLKVH